MTQKPTLPRDNKNGAIMVALGIYCVIMAIGVGLMVAHIIREWGH